MEHPEIQEVIKENEKKLDLFRGCLIGGAAGDALGYPVEFMTYDEIGEQYGRAGIRKYTLTGGKALISDDTQMTLFTATGLLWCRTRAMNHGIAPHLHDAVGRAYRSWYARQTETQLTSLNISWLYDVPEMGEYRAPGNTCMSAIGAAGPPKWDPYGTIEEPVNTSKGCGGVMRVAPVGLYLNRKPSKQDAIVQVDDTAARVAALTHGHELGWLPAAALAHIINRIVHGGLSLRAAVTDSIEFLETKYADRTHLGELTAIMRRAAALADNRAADIDNISVLGGGWIAEETLAIALYCALKYEHDFSKALCVSVNHSGDSDSTGAVTGNILGALWGYERIPEIWKKNLECHDVILEVADDLCRDCHMTEYGDYHDEDWLRKYIFCKWKDDGQAGKRKTGGHTPDTDRSREMPKAVKLAEKRYYAAPKWPRAGLKVTFGGRIDLSAVYGAAIVNPTDVHLSGAGGLDQAIHKAAGEQLAKECAKIKADLQPGQAIVTPGFGIRNCPRIVHVAVPKYVKGQERELTFAYSLALKAADGCRRLKLPLLGVGSMGWPVQVSLDCAWKAILEYSFYFRNPVHFMREWASLEEVELCGSGASLPGIVKRINSISALFLMKPDGGFRGHQQILPNDQIKPASAPRGDVVLWQMMAKHFDDPKYEKLLMTDDFIAEIARYFEQATGYELRPGEIGDRYAPGDLGIPPVWHNGDWWLDYGIPALIRNDYNQCAEYCRYDASEGSVARAARIHEDQPFYLTEYYDKSGNLYKYSYDIEVANDSHYEFSAKEAGKLRPFLSGYEPLREAFKAYDGDSVVSLLNKCGVQCIQFHY